MNRSQESIDSGELHPLIKFLPLPLFLKGYKRILCASRDLLQLLSEVYILILVSFCFV